MYPVLSTAALIAPAAILFGMNAVSVAVRIVAHQCRIMIFEVIQLVIAFALAVAAVLIFAPVKGAMTVGLTCLMLSASSYMGTVRYLGAREEQRSFRIFSVWSAGLLVAGAFWGLSSEGAATLLAAAAVAATYLARRMEQTMTHTAQMLNPHGATFLLCAAAMAGLPRYLYGTLAGTPPHYPGLAVVIVSICAASALVLGRHALDGAWQRLMHLTVALAAICAFTALLVHGVLAVAASLMPLDAHHVASLRTLAICAVALAVAFGGSRWARPELSVLAWIALAALGLKLLVQDLRHGHMGFLAASIALFAVTLMSVPRLLRLGSQMRIAAEMKIKNSNTREIPV
jgi:hypothetical protein